MLPDRKSLVNKKICIIVKCQCNPQYVKLLQVSLRWVNFSASLERFKTIRVSHCKVMYVLIIQVRWIGWTVLTSN